MNPQSPKALAHPATLRTPTDLRLTMETIGTATTRAETAIKGPGATLLKMTSPALAGRIGRLTVDQIAQQVTARVVRPRTGPTRVAKTEEALLVARTTRVEVGTLFMVDETWVATLIEILAREASETAEKATTNATMRARRGKMEAAAMLVDPQEKAMARRMTTMGLNQSKQAMTPATTERQAIPRTG